MKYVNDRVRRQDRLMDEQRALELSAKYIPHSANSSGKS